MELDYDADLDDTEPPTHSDTIADNTTTSEDTRTVAEDTAEHKKYYSLFLLLILIMVLAVLANDRRATNIHVSYLCPMY